MTVIYRPVPGYADLYAGMDGTIVHGGKGELKQTYEAHGYLVVRVPGIKPQKKVHRLVAAAFLGYSAMQVRHGDGVRDNNRLENLCYGTSRDNTQDAIHHGTHRTVEMSAKTHCPQGHSYSIENTYTPPNTNERQCRTCRQAARIKYVAENQEKIRIRSREWHRANRKAAQRKVEP